MRTNIDRILQRGAGRSALTGFLCTLLFCITILCIFLGIARTAVSRQTIETVIYDMNVGMVMEQFEIYEAMAEHIDQEVLDSIGVHPSTIDELLDQHEIRGDISEMLSSYIGALAIGDIEHEITTGDITRVIEDNVHSIERATGHRLTDSDIRLIENRINDSDILEQISVGAILENTQTNFGRNLWILSSNVLTMAWVLFAAVIICLLLINLRYIRLVLKDIGITLGIAGALVTLVGLLFHIIFSVIANEIARLVFIESFASVIRGSILTSGLTTLAIGVVLAIIGVIMTRRFENAYFDNRTY